MANVPQITATIMAAPAALAMAANAGPSAPFPND